MDQAFLDRLERWHQEDGYQQIIDAIEAVPGYQEDYELVGLLARAYNNLGQYGETAPFERAAVLLLSVAKQGEDDPLWHFRLGYAYYYLDHDEDALAEFRRAMELDPEDQDTRDFVADLSRRVFQPEAYGQEEMEAVERHIESGFGPFSSVYHELVSPDIHVDLCVVEPTEERPFYTVVTMGMGARRMDLPEELKESGLGRAEIAVCLPPDWRVGDGEEIWYWPLRWLKILARLPIEEGSWLGWGHTVPSGEPMAENADFAGVILLEPPFPGAEACRLPDGEKVNFYQMFPLYQEEMDFKLAHGAEALMERLDDLADPVVDLDRPNCCEGWEYEEDPEEEIDMDGED